MTVFEAGVKMRERNNFRVKDKVSVFNLKKLIMMKDFDLDYYGSQRNEAKKEMRKEGEEFKDS